MDTTTKTLVGRAASNQKVKTLLAMPKTSMADIAGFTPHELKCLSKAVSQKLSSLTGEARDVFYEKIKALLPESTRNAVWDHNHVVITEAISNFMNKHGAMPHKNYIADETGLSRQTIFNHLKDYQAQPQFSDEAGQFKFMSHKMLASVFRAGNKGDMRAARLYFEMTGALDKKQRGMVVNAQNNYIQINNTILSQENLKLLTTEDLSQIEHIVMSRQKVPA